MNHIDLKHCTLFAIDGTGINFIAIRIGEGNFAYTKKRNVDVLKSRGNLYSAREGEEEPVDISFQFVWDRIISSHTEPPTLEEVMDGTADNWVSATPGDYDPHAPFSVNLQIVRSLVCRQPNGTDVNDGETYNFPEFFYQEFSHSLKDATIECKGFSNRVRPYITREIA